MTKENLVKKVFIESFPIHYDIIGETNLNDIIDDDVEFTKTKKGYNSSSFEIIGASGTIIGILKIVYDVIQDRRNKKKDNLISDYEKLLETALILLKIQKDALKKIDMIDLKEGVKKITKELIDD